MTETERSEIVVGVTGGIACGKSEVGRILEGLGYLACDADRIAHELMAKGTAVYQRVVAAFGECILSEKGEIRRSGLGAIVLEDPEKRERLNELVHPAVRDAVERWIADRRARGESGAVQIPLLFESGMDNLDFDAVICVSAGETPAVERLAKRGMDRGTARKWIRAQMPLKEKEQLSDFTVMNSGSVEELEEAMRRIVKRLPIERSASARDADG